MSPVDFYDAQFYNGDFERETEPPHPPPGGATKVTKANLYCPKCGDEIPIDQTFWQWQGKWYCSEKCARAVSNQTRLI